MSPVLDSLDYFRIKTVHSFAELVATPFVSRSQKLLFDAVEDYNHGLLKQAAGPPSAAASEPQQIVVLRF